MKNSNKILLIAAAAVAVFIIVSAVAARAAVAGWFPAAGPPEEGVIEPAADLKDFTGIRASAAWEIEVRRGATYSVVIHASPAARERLIVRVSGNDLELGWAGGPFFPGPARLRADIVMPRLESIVLSGAGKVTITGFTEKRLAIVSSGAGAVVARNGTVGDLRVVLSGVGSVDFSDVPSTNADVELSGVGSLTLNMAGGELRGRLSGVGGIEYSGTVSAERVTRSGLGSISHR